MSLLKGLDLSTQVADSAPASMIARMLAAVREHLGMEVAYVSEFVENDSVYRVVDAPGLEKLIKPGDRRSLNDVYCRHIIEGRLPEIMADTADFPLAVALPITQAVPIRSHLSVPLKLDDGSVFGMFCCLSASANRSLNMRDLQVMRAFADLAVGQIEKDRSARNEDVIRRDRIDRVLKDGQLAIMFQPIFEFSQSRPTGFECLTRFNAEPRRSPDKWFAEAAKVGLGVDLELAAIKLALETARLLPGNVYVSVNASAEALVSASLASAIGDFPPDRLVIELTEHAAVDAYETLKTALAAYRNRGALLAIDDAGAGYAGLQHFVQLRPDLIKLDMALTRNIDKDPARRALAAALIFYAREMGCHLVAEGIETKDELMTLRVLGIQRGQGYLLGRPACVADTLQLLSGAKAA